MSRLPLVAAVVCLLSPLTAVAQTARKPCEELRSEIEAKIKANGVQSFELLIVTAAEAEERQTKQMPGKVVGSCDGGTKRIVYVRDAAPAAKP